MATARTARKSPASDPLAALSDHARHLVYPSTIVATEWPVVTRWADRAGVTFDPWQSELGMLLLGLDSTGHFASAVGLNTISIARQTGKTFLIRWIVFAQALAHPGTTWLWTSHHYVTTNDSFEAMAGLAGTDLFKAHVERVSRGAGNQSVVFRNGSGIRFGSRERGFGRGLPRIDGIVLDEAQILTSRAFADMLPTTNTARNPFVMLLGTPPKPTDPSEVFSWQRHKALKGDLPDGLYVEFGADADADLDDKAQWAKANPSYPSRTSDDAISRLRKNFSNAADFRREGLGIWDQKAEAQAVIPAGDWAACLVEAAPAEGVTSYGVKFSPDGSMVALAAALKPPGGGPIHVEALDYKAVDGGLGWLVKWLAERAGKTAQIVVDGRSGTGMLAAQLAEAGVRARLIWLPTADQAITANSMMLDAVTGYTVTHIGQPGLDDQVSHAGRRLIGNRGGWGWTPIGDTPDTAILDAVTLAHWAAKTTRRHPGRVLKPSC